MPGTSPSSLNRIPLLGLGAALLLSGCASAGHLGEYDFRDRALAVVSTHPPQPRVVIVDAPEVEERSWWRALIRVGTEVVRDAQADRAGEKMARAAEAVDVSALMADGVLERAATLLRARAVSSVQDADFEMEVRVTEYGIRADSWDSAAGFFIKAEVLLLDGETGRRIWGEEVDAWDPINPNRWGLGGSLGNLLTARALSDLSVSEIEGALEALGAYSAMEVAEKLEAGLERAGVR